MRQRFVQSTGTARSVARLFALRRAILPFSQRYLGEDDLVRKDFSNLHDWHVPTKCDVVNPYHGARSARAIRLRRTLPLGWLVIQSVESEIES